MTERSCLPTSWSWARFDEVAEVESDLVAPQAHASAPHIAPNHIESGTGRLLEFQTVAADGVTSPKHRFRAGQVLYSKIRPYLAKAVLVDFNGLCSADMYPVRSDIEARFLHRWLISHEFTALASKQQGRTVLPKINQDALNVLPVPVPPLNEQRRIVRKIEALTARSRAAREALEQVPPLLERFRQSVLAAAFRGDLTAEWRRQHPNVEPASVLLERVRAERRRRWEETVLGSTNATGRKPPSANWRERYEEPVQAVETDLTDLPDGWGWATVDELCHLVRGASPRPKGDPRYFGGNIPWITIADVTASPGRVVRRTKEFVTEAGADRSRLLAEGTLILSNSGTVCVPKFLGMRGCIHDGWVALLDLSRLTVPDLLYFYFEFIRPSVRRKHRQGATQVNLNTDIVRSFPIPVPPLEEQRELLSKLDRALTSIDSLEREVARAVEGTQKLDQATLAKAFRGELVPQDPSDEPASVLLDRIRAERTAVLEGSTKPGPGKTSRRGRKSASADTRR